MRILHLPTPVGGMPWGLAQAERKVGLNSRVLYTTRNPYDYPADIKVNFNSNSLIKKMQLYQLSHSISKNFDVLHFNSGKTMVDIDRLELYALDLPNYKKNKIFVTFNGCDARQKNKRLLQTEISACKYCLDDTCGKKYSERRKKILIEKFQKAGAVFFAVNPDLFHFLPRNTIFLPYAISDWDKIGRASEKNDGKTLHIVHAPTNREIKGTDSVVKACKKINEKYPNAINLDLVENISYAQALKRYASADVIIDQLRVGWYGGFAVEVMKMGIPVVAYINEDDLIFIPAKMKKDVQEAIICANEKNIENVLMMLYDNRELLAQYKLAQMEYVNYWHNPIRVAKITKKYYER